MTKTIIECPECGIVAIKEMIEDENEYCICCLSYKYNNFKIIKQEEVTEFEIFSSI